MLGGLAWVGARARWFLAVGVLVATLLPSLSAFLRPLLPGLVALVFCIAMVRLDLRALALRALRPRRLALLSLWTLALLALTPAAVWAGARAAGLGEAHVAALTYTFAAPPITSAAALCLILGLDAALALELTVFASLATPLIGPLVTKALLGEAVPLDAAALMLRVAAMIGAGWAMALLVRQLAGTGTIERHHAAFDGVAAMVLVLFVIPLYDRFWGVVGAMPGYAAATLGLVLAANFGVQAAVAAGFRRAAAPPVAGAAGLMWGNRNVSLYLAALPPDPLFGLYVAFYQFPMLFTPVLMGPLLGRRARA
jgi:predicted Na+-dependent transporter